MITGYYEELKIGTTTRSRGRTITEADVVGFAGLSGDWHPLHTDAEYAAKGPFGARIGHGMLTLAVCTGLMTLSPVTVEAFYGMDRVRFIRPVRLGDTIRVETTVAEKIPREGGGGRVVVACEVVNQSNEPVAAFQMIFVVSSAVVHPRPDLESTTSNA
jgi:3-hydroxybutyryl-CoA dehydratase